MASFVDIIATEETGVVIDSETHIASYTPSLDGRLKKVIVEVGGIAATSLIESGYIKLACTTFGGVEMFVPFHGIGLETVPRADKQQFEQECDLEIKSGVPIRIFCYYNVAPTTPELFVFAKIEG